MREFERAIKLLKRLHDRLYNAYASFYIWEAFQKLMAPNVLGEDDAQENVKVINSYKEFFSPTIYAHNKTFIIELAKFFDTDKSALSVSKIINCVESSQKKFTVEEFKEYNNGRKYLNNLVKSYQGVTNAHLDKCKNRLYKEGLDIRHQKIIKDSKIWKLRKLRDQWIAHDQINKNDNNITNTEIKKLFQIAGETINEISSNLNHETTWHTHEKDYIKSVVKSIIDKLKK